MENNNTFLRVTNKDIYKSIQDLHKKIDNECISVNVCKVKTTHLNRLVIGAYSFIMAVLGFLISHIITK